MKNENLTKNIFIIGCLTVSLVIFFSLYIAFVCITGNLSIFKPNQNKIEKILIKEYDDFNCICDFFETINGNIDNEKIVAKKIDLDKYDYDNNNYSVEIWYENTDGGIDTVIHKIDDNEIIDAIKNLKSKNVRCIENSYRNNYIMFILWSSMDSSCGLVYSFNNTLPVLKNNSFGYGEVDVEPLSKNDWYYYKHIDE